MSTIGEISDLINATTVTRRNASELMFGDSVAKAYRQRYMVAFDCAITDARLLTIDHKAQNIPDTESAKIMMAYFRDRFQKHLDDMNKLK